MQQLSFLGSILISTGPIKGQTEWFAGLWILNSLIDFSTIRLHNTQGEFSNISYSTLSFAYANRVKVGEEEMEGEDLNQPDMENNKQTRQKLWKPKDVIRRVGIWNLGSWFICCYEIAFALIIGNISKKKKTKTGKEKIWIFQGFSFLNILICMMCLF